MTEVTLEAAVTIGNLRRETLEDEELAKVKTYEVQVAKQRKTGG